MGASVITSSLNMRSNGNPFIKRSRGKQYPDNKGRAENIEEGVKFLYGRERGTLWL